MIIYWCVSPFYNDNACVYISSGQIIGFVSKNGDFKPYDGDFKIVSYSGSYRERSVSGGNVIETEHFDENDSVDWHCCYTKDGKEVVKFEESYEKNGDTYKASFWNILVPQTENYVHNAAFQRKF